jgi:hypothetical protein
MFLAELHRENAGRTVSAWLQEFECQAASSVQFAGARDFNSQGLLDCLSVNEPLGGDQIY